MTQKSCFEARYIPVELTLSLTRREQPNQCLSQRQIDLFTDSDPTGTAG